MEITKEQVLEIVMWGNSNDRLKIKKWFPDAFKVELEVGKVYKLRDMLIIFKGKQEAYGFSDAIWFNNEGWELHENKSEWQEATTEEWESALIEEAKKRGFKNGNYECLSGVTEKVIDNYFFYNNMVLQGSREHSCRFNQVFKEGVWAEIIKTFSKEEAEKLLGGKII